MTAELLLAALVGGVLRISPALAWAAVGDCLAQRSGRFNIGIEGIVPCGAVAALAAADAAGGAAAGVAGGALAGAVLGLAFALCCALPRVNELAVGIAFLVGGTALARFAGGPLTGLPVPELAAFDLAALFGSGGARGTYEVSVLLPLALLLALALAWMLANTRAGMLLCAAGGANGDAALAAVGVRAERLRVLAVSAGGACAGIGGASLVMFYPRGWSDHLADGVGISALVLVFLARSRPVAAFVAALAFSAIASAGLALQAALGSEAHHFLNALPYAAVLLALMLPAALAARGRPGT